MPSSGFQTCARSEEHTSELQSHSHLVCRLLLEKKHNKVKLDEGQDLFATTGQPLEACVRLLSLQAPSVDSRPVPAPSSKVLVRIRLFLIETPPPEISPLSLPDALPI